MSKLRISFVASLFFALGGSLPLHASITNGSFETPTVPAGSYTDYLSGSTGITGWTVVGSGGDVAVVSGSFAEGGVAFPAEDGSQWLDLTGVTANSTEGVEQTVATTAGTSYTLSFWVGNVDNPGASFGTTSAVNVYLSGVGGTLLGTFTNSSTTSNTLVWQQFTPTFTATGSSTTIDFINEDPSTDNSNGLDNVVLTANASVTPEPTTVILYGTGLLSIMGLALRRKRLA
jgi:hypothetical protein